MPDKLGGLPRWGYTALMNKEIAIDVNLPGLVQSIRHCPAQYPTKLYSNY